MIPLSPLATPPFLKGGKEENHVKSPPATGGFFFEKRAEWRRNGMFGGRRNEDVYDKDALPVQLFSCGDGYSFFFILSSGRVFCILAVKFDRFVEGHAKTF
jgi:hypothetical protein